MSTYSLKPMASVVYSMATCLSCFYFRLSSFIPVYFLIKDSKFDKYKKKKLTDL